MVRISAVRCLAAVFLMAGMADGFSGMGISPARGWPPLRCNHSARQYQRGASRAFATRMMAEDAEQNMPGSWNLEAELDDVDLRCFLSLNGDRTVNLPLGSNLGGNRFPARVMWKLKGDSFSLEFDRDHGFTSPFFDLTMLGKLNPDEMMATGTVMQGEFDPEYVGKFTLKQIIKSGVLVKVEDEEVEVDPLSGLTPAPPGLEDWNGDVDEEAWFDD